MHKIISKVIKLATLGIFLAMVAEPSYAQTAPTTKVVSEKTKAKVNDITKKKFKRKVVVYKAQDGDKTIKYYFNANLQVMAYKPTKQSEINAAIAKKGPAFKKMWKDKRDTQRRRAARAQKLTEWKTLTVTFKLSSATAGEKFTADEEAAPTEQAEAGTSSEQPATGAAAEQGGAGASGAAAEQGGAGGAGAAAEQGGAGGAGDDAIGAALDKAGPAVDQAATDADADADDPNAYLEAEDNAVNALQAAGEALLAAGDKEDAEAIGTQIEEILGSEETDDDSAAAEPGEGADLPAEE